MQYGPGIDEDVPESTSALGEASPEAIVGAPDVSAHELARMQYFRGFTRRRRVFCAEELVDDVFLAGAREGHVQDRADKCADTGGAIYFYPRLREGG